MTCKTTVLYRSVLEEINELAKLQEGKCPCPEVVISDFELAILGAVASEFPSSRTRGCWFHFSQAIFKHATNKLGLKKSYKLNNWVKKIIRMLSALALLESNKVREGFQVISLPSLPRTKILINITESIPSLFRIILKRLT